MGCTFYVLPREEVQAPPRKASETAHVRDLKRVSSKDLHERWTEQREPFAEYRTAAHKICLEDEWVVHTRLARYLRMTAEAFRGDPNLKKRMADLGHFRSLARRVVQKGYRIEKEAQSEQTVDLVHSNCNVFDTLVGLFSGIDWRQPYLAYAVDILVKLEEPDAIVAKLSEVCDRAPRCSSAKRQAFNILVAHSFHLSEQTGVPSKEADLNTLDGARQHFNTCMEDYLDDHKERAFNSSFMQPARFYFDCVGDHSARDHVNVHGLNWYLALLHSTLGVQTPTLPELSDVHVMGVADFWAGLKDECWHHFSDPEVFGADFEGVKQLKGKGHSAVRQRVPPGEFPRGMRTPHPKVLGNAAVNPKDAKTRKALVVYVERFAHFFSREFFLPKALATLNSEVKPEHAGFRRACETLYRHFCTEQGAQAESFVEHCYRDDYFMELDLEAVEHFFAWLGVVKPGVVKLDVVKPCLAPLCQ